MSLRPTEVIIFGNPKGGTPLMQASQTMGIDLAFEGARLGRMKRAQPGWPIMIRVG